MENDELDTTEAEVTTDVTVEDAPMDEADFQSIREHFEAGTDLSDEEVDTIADSAVAILRSLLGCFGESQSGVDEYEGDEGELILDVNGGDLAILIGRHGRTLDALQQIVSSLLSNKIGFHYPVVVDIEGYKSRRKQKVQSIALSAASRSKKQGEAVKLAPMNAYERRLVHIALRDDASVSTHSEGEDPDRYVVITPVHE
ncbi:MAG: KH domain-containing protein [Atopobiaceae bacterium]|jgi:spoIIIJ-associated protein|nr:KH domain-containing protein [Atopobiaceae bacterium]MCI2173663.1 KH domain-containing protein [Atopobiaceae bacterium]MCI2207695.1 KH domain-containing protein [Atopobiaceae bacterium]